MKELIQKIFRCEYCGRVYLQENHCKYHEERCMKNPENIPACFECKHYQPSHFSTEHDQIEDRDSEGRYLGMHDGIGHTSFEPARCALRGDMISKRMKCKLLHPVHGKQLLEKMVDWAGAYFDDDGKAIPEKLDWESWLVMPNSCQLLNAEEESLLS